MDFFGFVSLYIIIANKRFFFTRNVGTLFHLIFVFHRIHIQLPFFPDFGDLPN